MTQHRKRSSTFAPRSRPGGAGGGLETRLLVSTLEYAAEQVNALVEVKRVRKAAAPAL